MWQKAVKAANSEWLSVSRVLCRSLRLTPSSSSATAGYQNTRDLEGSTNIWIAGRQSSWYCMEKKKEQTRGRLWKISDGYNVDPSDKNTGARYLTEGNMKHTTFLFYFKETVFISLLRSQHPLKYGSRSIFPRQKEILPRCCWRWQFDDAVKTPVTLGSKMRGLWWIVFILWCVCCRQ